MNESFEVMIIIPERYPPAVDEKVAMSEQFVPGAMVGVRLEQGVDPPGATLNRGPVVEIEETTRSSVPAFDSWNSFGVDMLPTGTSPKLYVAGDREIVGPALTELVPRTIQVYTGCVMG